jgi:16S rRNA processing protein RimM
MADRIQPPYLALGEILRPHGIKGEVRMRVLTDFPERLPKMKTVFIGNSPTTTKAKTIELENVRLLPEDIALLKFVGLDNRNDVEYLRGQFILIDTPNAVPLEDDEYYTYQLIGLTVVTENGRILGKIKDIMETGANDVIIVDGTEGTEILIPDAPNVWVELDFDGGIATVNLPDGLLPAE